MHPDGIVAPVFLVVFHHPALLIEAGAHDQQPRRQLRQAGAHVVIDTVADLPDALAGLAIG